MITHVPEFFKSKTKLPFEQGMFDFELIYKWKCNGSNRQSGYKQ